MKDFGEKAAKGLVMYLAELIRARQAEGATMETLGRRAGVDKSTVSRWLSFQVSPKMIEAFRAIEAWGGSIAEAMRRAGSDEIAAICEHLSSDPATAADLAAILTADHPMREKLIRDIQDYARLIKAG